MNLMVRTRGEPLAMTGTLREAVWSVDRQQPITSVLTFDDAMNESLARPRLLTVLLGIFGALGLLLGALGLYGVLSYLVNQRQRDIGVRLALGARPGDVLQMVVKRGLTLAAVGVAIGVVGALTLGRFLSGVLYDVQPTDPLTLVAVTTVLLAVAALASWLPARRAARVDPVVTLREE
jgi:ABC-type antimicrobial peptide transport system permease subunit